MRGQALISSWGSVQWNLMKQVTSRSLAEVGTCGIGGNISVLPQVAFLTQYKILQLFQKYKTQNTKMDGNLRCFGILSLLKSPSKQQSWAFAVKKISVKFWVSFEIVKKIPNTKYKIQRLWGKYRNTKYCKCCHLLPKYRNPAFFLYIMPTSACNYV